MSTGISGTAELSRTADFGDVYTKYKVRRYTKSVMFWDALGILKMDKELKFVFGSMSYFEYRPHFGPH